jgi:hypothetical protein
MVSSSDATRFSSASNLAQSFGSVSMAASNISWWKITLRENILRRKSVTFAAWESTQK